MYVSLVTVTINDEKRCVTHILVHSSSTDKMRFEAMIKSMWTERQEKMNQTWGINNVEATV